MFEWLCGRIVPVAVREMKETMDKDVVERASCKAQFKRVRDDFDDICELGKDNPKIRMQCENTRVWLEQTDDFKRSMTERKPAGEK